MRTTRDARGDLLRKAAIAAAIATAAVALFVAMRAVNRPAVVAAPEPPVRDATRPAGVAQRGAGVRPTTARAVPVRERDESRARHRPAADEHRASDPSEAADAEPQIDARDYIAALRADGQTEGLAAFPPPGTRPPQAGVVVPDDYELPEGFMRHYQSTDDGGQLEPVLTLSPGYELVDENGQPIALLPDRIVPPEFAPPDLPVRILEVPTRDRAQAER